MISKSGDMAVWDMIRVAEGSQNGAIKKMFDKQKGVDVALRVGDERRQMGDEVSVYETCMTYSLLVGQMNSKEPMYF